MTENGLEKFMQRVEARKAQHRTDVEYVQANHAELAAWLSEMTAEFGRCEYRVTMREVKDDPLSKRW